MKTAVLGKTNLTVGKIGFGGIPVQRETQESACKAVEFCLANGLNFFDTARGYSNSEQLIGESLKTKRSSVLIASKTPSLSRLAFVEQANVSLAQLDTSYLDLFQVHNVKSTTDCDRIFDLDGAYEGFRQLQAEKKVLHFGLTSHSADVLMYAISKYFDKIETIMFPYNIVETQGTRLFKQAKLHNIGTIAMKPLAGGNIDDIQLALKFVFDNPDIDIAIPGIGNIEEAKQDLSFDFSPLSDTDKEVCHTVVQKLGQNFCRRCNYCAPCKKGLDIPGILTLQNYLHKYGLANWAKTRYNAQQFTAKDCIQCGECETRCPYSLKIREKLLTVASDFQE